MSKAVDVAGELLIAIEEKSLQIEVTVRQANIGRNEAQQYLASPVHAYRVQALATLVGSNRGKKED